MTAASDQRPINGEFSEYSDVIDAHIVATVSEIVARRTAPIVAQQPIAVFCAPPEYQPLALARAVMRNLYQDDPRIYRLSQSHPDMLVAAMHDGPLILVCDTLCQKSENPADPSQKTEKASASDSSHPAMSLEDAYRVLNTQSLQPQLQVILVVPSDSGLPETDIRLSWAMTIGHRDMTMLPSELGEISALAHADDGVRYAILRSTGGVMAFVAALLQDDLAGERRGEMVSSTNLVVPAATSMRVCRQISCDEPAPTVAVIAQGWAERVLPLFLADELRFLYLWLGRVSTQSSTLIASQIYQREVNTEQIQQVYRGSVFTEVSSNTFAVPYFLCKELQRQFMHENPHECSHWERKVLAALNHPQLSALESVRVLTTLHAWSELERVIRTSAYVLIALSDGERRWLSVLWPEHVPSQLQCINQARSIIEQSTEAEQQNGQYYTDVPPLVRLLSIANPPVPSLAAEAKQQLKAVFSAKANRGLAAVSVHLEKRYEWLDYDAIVTKMRPRHPDDIILYIMLLVYSAVSAVSVGNMAIAQKYARTALRVHDLDVLGGELQAEAGLLIHSLAAFVAVEAGAIDVAQSYSQSGWRKFTAYMNPGQQTRRLIEIAQHEIACANGTVSHDPAVHPEAVETTFSAQAMCAEATRLALVFGMNTAWEYLTMCRTYVTWSTAPSWIWWPIDYMRAIVACRIGRIAVAESIVERYEMPAEVELVLQAVIAEAKGQAEVAHDLAQTLISLDNLPRRWSFVALGVMIGTNPAADDKQKLQALMGAVNWDTSLSSVCMFSDVAKERVSSAIQPSVREDLVGLSGVKTDGISKKVELTARQREVLALLDSSDTLADIAAGQYVSVETIRSTVKGIYRKLGVHDRRSAVAMGRLMHLIDAV
ncbi:helix-turn-helix domain-containing protein [Trueperella sp. LYQ141]|uniref:helix-turn-helix domain-containing protein n=1 Tax=Trueperella sp. LYQ141 TaxID=3391058 RepID=UPI003982F633